jgi:ubiquitin carboxyl-terminal hydrolase 10
MATPSPHYDDLVARLASAGPPPPLRRVAFANSGNLCFLNATMQALVCCAPFCSLLLALRAQAAPVSEGGLGERLPPRFATLRSLDALGRELSAAGSQGEAAAGRWPIACSEELFAASLRAFEAAQGAGGGAARAGRVGAPPARRAQQDAQEFLSFLLDSADTELLALKSAGGRATPSGGGSAAAADAPPPAEAAEEEEWESVGRRNRSALTRSHEALSASAETPLTALFGGVLASVVSRRGARPSRTLEPFKLLSLDVSSPRVASVAEALALYCQPEVLEQYKDGRGASTLCAQKTLCLHAAPRLLLLHLKLFRYGPGGQQKLLRRPQLELSRLRRLLYLQRQQHRLQLRRRRQVLLLVRRDQLR